MQAIEDSEEEWLQERGAIEQEVAENLSDPLYRLFTRVDEDMFTDTPHAHDSSGSKDSFEYIRPKDLVEVSREPLER
jgi:zinc protease